MIYLAQSDTTVGFLSRDAKSINRIKQRDENQKVLQTVADLKTLQTVSRIPKKYRRFVRRAKKTTFILPNGEAIRVVDKSSLHHPLVKKLGRVYSSSANVTKERFSESHAHEKSDIIVKDSRGFFEDSASKMYKLSKSTIKRLR
jgi:tRNA A37 threonylcarbamoyladenosine synthetase subunit TsaC/SUA5/YrdC